MLLGFLGFIERERDDRETTETGRKRPPENRGAEVQNSGNRAGIKALPNDGAKVRHVG